MADLLDRVKTSKIFRQTIVRLNHGASGPQPNGLLPYPGTGRFRWSLDFLPREQHFCRSQCGSAIPRRSAMLEIFHIEEAEQV